MYESVLFIPLGPGLGLTMMTPQTPRGTELLRNFSVDICGAQPNWVMSDFIEQEIARIRKLVGDKSQVIGAVSGGVDSTVAARLMTEAIGMLDVVTRVKLLTHFQGGASTQYLSRVSTLSLARI